MAAVRWGPAEVAAWATSRGLSDSGAVALEENHIDGATLMFLDEVSARGRVCVCVCDWPHTIRKNSHSSSLQHASPPPAHLAARGSHEHVLARIL
jgi:hypothetical protein